MISENFESREPPRPPPEITSGDGAEQYEVESLLRKRNYRNQIQYLVKWKGYPDYESTWEPRWRLSEDCPLLVKKFDAQNLNSKTRTTKKRTNNH